MSRRPVTPVTPEQRELALRTGLFMLAMFAGVGLAVFCEWLGLHP